MRKFNNTKCWFLFLEDVVRYEDMMPIVNPGRSCNDFSADLAIHDNDFSADLASHADGTNFGVAYCKALPSRWVHPAGDQKYRRLPSVRDGRRRPRGTVERNAAANTDVTYTNSSNTALNYTKETETKLKNK